MEIINKKVSELKPYENNPRKNDKAVDYVANSIKEFGFKVPIIIDKNNVIVTGHTRLKAAEKLGLKEVPCILADDLSEEQIKAFRIADNKTGEIATWDLEKLNLEFEIMDFDMSNFGFDFEKTNSEYNEIERKDLSDEIRLNNALEVECADENDLQNLYDELVERNYKCKII